ncbi:MAG: maleylacetoacetate isomerase [Myxococcota bacterium]
MKLYGYWRSSSSWRVRIALSLKELPYDYVAVNLLKSEQLGRAHRARHPRGRVPVLELDDGTHLGESLAIIDYLEHLRPEPALWPAEPVARARAHEMAQAVNSGIQPLQNLAVLKALEAEGIDRKAWGATYNRTGLEALETLAQREQGRGPFLCGSQPSVADVCLVPQLYNARRFDVDVSAFPRLLEVEARCAEVPAFTQSHPDQQPDAVRA